MNKKFLYKLSIFFLNFEWFDFSYDEKVVFNGIFKKGQIKIYLNPKQILAGKKFKIISKIILKGKNCWKFKKVE